MFLNIDVGELQRLQAEGPVNLIDVRTEAEVARGLINGADHIPLPMLPVKASEIDTRIPTVLYCQSGGRSAHACMFLAANGFRDLYNLQGGVMAWVRSGFPLCVPV